MERQKIGYAILTASAVLVLSGLFFVDPILQDEKYHLFSDSRTLFKIPNFWNVVSNLPFLIIGILGLYRFRPLSLNSIPYILLFFGISMVAIGSSYYHVNPNNGTLIWDRLPMTIAFMSLFSIVICEFISVKTGNMLLWPFIFLGLISALYWYFGEAGDLRYYALVQFYPMMAIPVILIFFKSKFIHISGYWMLLAIYIVAKLFEHFDTEIYEFLGFISGHSLKHFAAASGLYLIYDMYSRRTSLKITEVIDQNNGTNDLSSMSQ